MTFRGSTSRFLWNTQIDPLTLKYILGLHQKWMMVIKYCKIRGPDIRNRHTMYFKVNGSISVFLQKSTYRPSGYHGSYFYSHHHNPNTWKPPESIWIGLGKLEFFRKSACRTSRVHEVILLHKFVIRGWKPYSGNKLSIFMNFGKNRKILSVAPYTLEGTILWVKYQKFRIFVYWNLHRASFKRPTTFHIKWD